VDRVRWGAIIAGLLAALSTLAVLGVLGAAIGFSAYDAGDNARPFGVGASWWGAISMLISLAVGGWLAARTAAVRGQHNGVLNGAMVWVTAIPLLTYVLVGGVASTARTAIESGSRVTAERRDINSRDITDQAQQAADRMRAAVTPDDVNHATNSAAKTSWITLASLLLSLGASAIGGYVGSRNATGQIGTRQAGSYAGDVR
jgi:hypothetical protein